MVRETRHLWVGNLPENIREDRIREHFKRYGRVQSVKIFSRKGGECDGNGLVGCGPTGICATVSFMDIKSASKAHAIDHKLDEHSLTTEYHEPAPIPTAAPAPSVVPPSVSAGGSPVAPQPASASLRHPPPYSSPRFTHGPNEEITTFDRSSHFYERRDGTENYVRRPPSAYHVVSPSESLRGRNRERDRIYRNGPPHYTPILDSVVARTPPTHHRTVASSGWNSYESTTCSRYPSSVVSTPEILSYPEERRESTPVIIVHKKHPKSRRKCRVMPRCGSNGSESVSNNSDSSRSRSHSSSSSSHSRSSSSSSDSSSAAISERSCSTHSHHGSLKSTVTVHSTISTPLTNCSPVVHTDDRRPLAICVRNLPTRSSDSSVKDGLYHEYKKHGKLTHVKIVGQGANRYAIVCFKKADDVDKAIQASHDKVLFGSKIEVTVYHGYDVDDSDFRPIDAALDEYHPKATRTLFIGNLEKDVTVNDLRNMFQKFGEIIDIDIRKQGTTCYAFCQYCDISSVVKAMHALDGEYLGNSKINLGYGKSQATNCLWVAGVADCVTEKQLIGSFSQFGQVTHVDINRSQGKALVFFQQISHAQAALSQMRGYNLKNRRLIADYASVECQENFYEHYEKSKSVSSVYENNCQDSPRSTSSQRGLDTPVSSSSSNNGNSSTKHCTGALSNSNNIAANNANGNNNGGGGNSSSGSSNSNGTNKASFRFQQHAAASTISSSSTMSSTTMTITPLRTTPTHQSVQRTPSSSSASPIVNNTPSPSPSTSSRSTPRPQQTSRFDYTNALECTSERRTSRSFEDLNANVDSGDKTPPPPQPPPPPPQQDDVMLQKERVSLLEQLNDYSSSGEEDEEAELTSIKQQHQTTTTTAAAASSTAMPTTLQRQRQRSTSSREESRPGTPLCDERPENILAHYESRRAAKEKNTNNTPLSLPLPSFANKVPRSTSPTERSSKSPHLKPSLSSSSSVVPPPSHHQRSFDGARNPLSCTKEKPGILDSKLSSLTPFDSLTETLKAPWIDQLKSLDEKYEKWSTKVQSGKLDTSAVHTKHKLLDVNSIGKKRSEICQTVLSRKSVFDDHIKRLETVTDSTTTTVATDFISPRVNATSVTSNRSHSTLVSSTAIAKPLTSSTLNNVSSLVMKGLQYPFPSHPPIKATTLSSSSLSKVSATSAALETKPLPDTVAATSLHGSNARTTLLLRNNSVEKLTELPKNTPSPVTTSLSRLDSVELRKDLLSPAGSRRSSVESVGRKEDGRKLEAGKLPLTNHVDVKFKLNNSYETKENNVLDKRKCSADNAVSVISHTTHKLRDSLEDVSSETGALSRRSSIESNSTIDDEHKCDDRSTWMKKSFDKNHKLSNEVKRIETQHHDKTEAKPSKPIVVCNHVDDKKEEKRPKEPPKVQNVLVDDEKPKEENSETKTMIDEDDDDSNDIDDNKTIVVKNKIIETVFHIKHEKKKGELATEERSGGGGGGKASSSNEKKKPIATFEQSCVKSVTKECHAKEFASASEAPKSSKKECIKTKEFNMFENKTVDKKRNHFLSEPRKSVELDQAPKDEFTTLKNAKHKDKELVKEKEHAESSVVTAAAAAASTTVVVDKMATAKSEKKKEKHVDGGGKHKESTTERRSKNDEKRDEPKPIGADSDIVAGGCGKHRDDKHDRKHEAHRTIDAKKESPMAATTTSSTTLTTTATATITVASAAAANTAKCREADKEKKREKAAGQPENGKIRHHDYKKYKDTENHKRKSIEKELKMEGDGESDRCVESKVFHRSKFALDVTKSDATSKERKNSSGSSSLSDSMHSKGKMSNAFDSQEEEKSRHDSIDESSSHHHHSSSRTYDKHRGSNVASTGGETNSGKEDRKGDPMRPKKLERTSTSSSNASSSKRKKSSGSSSKKRKTPSDSSSDSEFESYDESKANSKNHSIFDVVLDEPAYISMYDKVKARSTKNLQKQEEEKRQQKLKEKFNQLKQSRVKREEKKRSTSYDDDTDAERGGGGTMPRKNNKLILDSSDEEHSGQDKLKSRVPSDSSDDDDDASKKLPASEDDDGSGNDSAAKKYKKSSSRRALSVKSKEKSKHHALTDTSEDELKLKHKRERQFALLSETKRKFKKSMSKKAAKRAAGHRGDKKKTESDGSDDEKRNNAKTKSLYNRTKLEVEKIFSDFSDDDVKSDKMATKLSSLMDDKKRKSDSHGEKIKSKDRDKSGEGLKLNNFIDHHKSKLKMLISDVSEEDDASAVTKPIETTKTKLKKSDFVMETANRSRFDKLLSDTSESESIKSSQFLSTTKKRCNNIYSEDSELDVTIKREEKNDDELYYNLAELHNDYAPSENSSPPPLLDPINNANNEFGKKKSHKKKQKRQKSREHSIDRNKKHSKKERRKSVLSDAADDETGAAKEKEHKMKPKKKKKNRDKLKIESLEEDIFGSMSDDSEKLNEPAKLSKFSVTDVYDADSDSSNKDVRETDSKVVIDDAKFALTKPNVGSTPVIAAVSTAAAASISAGLDATKVVHSGGEKTSYENYFEHMKSKKKKRKKSKEEKSSKHHHHHHHHHHNHHHTKHNETTTSTAAEKQQRDVPPSLSLPCLDDESSPRPPLSSSLPSLSSSSSGKSTTEFDFAEEATTKVKQPPKEEEAATTVDAHRERKLTPKEAVDIVTSSIAECIGEKKDYDGAGEPKTTSSDASKQRECEPAAQNVGQNVHDRAVLSIAAADTAVMSISEPPPPPATTPTAAAEVTTTETPPTVACPIVDEKPKDDKSGVAISQEETEDAIAAILGESSATLTEPSEFGYASCYGDDSMKPDTPGSDRNELQIDTDTEDFAKFANESAEEASSSNDDSFVSTNESLMESIKPPIIAALRETTPEADANTDNSIFCTPEGARSDAEVEIADRKPQRESAAAADTVAATEPVVEADTKNVAVKADTSDRAAKATNAERDEDIAKTTTTTVDRELDLMAKLAEKRLNNNCVKPPNNSKKGEAKNATAVAEPVAAATNDTKRRERKRSYAECNGPTSVAVPPDERDKHKHAVVPPLKELANRSKSLEEERSASSALTATFEPITPITPVSEKCALDGDARFPTLREPTSPSAVKLAVDEPTHKTVVGKEESSTTKCCSVARESSPTLAIKTEKQDADTALKQKLPIPAQQNTDAEGKDASALANTTEASEANKENVVNQEKITEPIDETAKSNVIVKNKEITRSVEDEIFKGVTTDFAKCNHKVPENNRNMLEKVVQRIHESKRILIVPKSEELGSTTPPSPQQPQCGDKMPDDELTPAKIMLKIHETSVIKNQIVDYNCVIKVEDESTAAAAVKNEPKSEEVDASFEAGSKTDSSYSSIDAQHESNEEMADAADETHAADNGDGKFPDHSYNAKRGRRRKATASAAGVTTRRGKHNNTIKETAAPTPETTTPVKKSTADVYEFQEDSEEEVKRPRLILTIKSPQSQSVVVAPPPPTATEAPSVITEHKSVSPPLPANAVATATTPTLTSKAAAALTRKSRRLQEKEGVPRNAVDETIEKVVKTAQSPRPTRRTTRVAAQAAAAIITTVHESTRKGGRAAKKTPLTTPPKSEAAAQHATAATAAGPMASESQPIATTAATASAAAATEDEDDDFPPSPTTSSASSTSPSTAVPSSPVSARIVSTEPTTLIDPVSGLLIPMKEAEEGQYVPALTELNQSRRTPDFPPEKKPRWDDSMVAEESAISLVKSDKPTCIAAATTVVVAAATSVAAKPIETISTAKAGVIASTATSVIAAAPAVVVPPPVAKAIPPVLAAATIPPEITLTPHGRPPSTTDAAAIVEDGPISLIKTTTASVVSPVAAAAIKPHPPHSVAFNQSYSSVVYSLSQPVTKLHTSKTVIPQPRVMTPITPKAHIMQQVLNADSEIHSNDEVPYPPQYSSPLLHGAVASPPLGSPKISPQPIVTGANNTRAAHTMKNMGPLEPLKIDPAAAFYYMSNTSPQSRPALAVQSPSPQPRVVHNALQGPNLPHYLHPSQFIYQPYMQEQSLTPYHHIPAAAAQISASSAAASAKIIAAEREIIDGRQPPVALSVTPSPPLELRKKGSPRPRVCDSPLITSPYVQNNRAFYYDEPTLNRAALQSRIRVSTPPYASKVPQSTAAVDPIDGFPPRRLHLEAARYAGHLDNEDEARHPRAAAYIAGAAADREGAGGYVGTLQIDGRIAAATRAAMTNEEGELDYSTRGEMTLIDGAVPRSRDSPQSQMDSPPLGDSPPQGNLDSNLIMQMYPIIWQGLLALKNDQAAVQMHVVSGNTSVAYDALPKIQDGFQPLLRIAQRMRLEQAQLEGVYRKMEIKDEHCTILGLPCGKNQEEVVQQITNLESCIIPYLQQKKAAGIINTAAPGTQQAAFVVHVFPPCPFADQVLHNAAPDLYRKVQESAYLVCIIVTV